MFADSATEVKEISEYLCWNAFSTSKNVKK